ncbi:Holliday junction branch migration protein RuvA [Candidatus Dojkabacteria bacterium]|nr:Holliday junction branch migration protein RuvA [Candidatus Dojkabacteria bacterium]
MISVLNGKIIRKESSSIDLLTASGLGFNIFVSQRDLDNLSESETTTLLIYHYIRENREDLFGFSNLEDKLFFEKLISISGVGPATAIDILSQFSVTEFAKLLDEKDVKKICTIKGLGNKTARRIVLELAEKLVTDDTKKALDPKSLDKLSKVSSALKSLAFSSKEVEAMISKLSKTEIEGESTESLVYICLKDHE